MPRGLWEVTAFKEFRGFREATEWPEQWGHRARQVVMVWTVHRVQRGQTAWMARRDRQEVTVSLAPLDLWDRSGAMALMGRQAHKVRREVMV